ncbi:MAG: peptidylprolyl isomerase [Pseudomonadota bacterium]|jgi:peptidylprolyl isomerase
MNRSLAVALVLLLGLPTTARADEAPPPTMADVLEASTPADWRRPAPEDTLYLELATGRVVIELAAAFAPKHVAQIRALANAKYYDGLAIVRVQENYVVQWGDPDAADAEKRRSTGDQPRTLAAEFARPIEGAPAFARLADGDVYAPEVGHSQGFPVARDPKQGTTWLAHCYGMLGAGRDDAADSGGGTELYVVIGHAPRHLDRNVTLVGRVLTGMEHLSTLPRGSAAMGFHEKAEQRVPIRAIRLANEVPAAERSALEVFRTDTAAFQRLVESRRNRREPWFLDPTGRIELCNVPVPVRAAKD